MKKFLAILLSIVMLFSLGVVSFAEDEVPDDAETTVAELPANMGKLEGKIVLSFDNTYIEPSTKYTIPLRLYGDFTAPEDAETVYIGAGGIGLTGDLINYATFNGVTFNDEINATPIEIDYLADADDTVFSFSVSKENFDSVLSTSDEGIIIGYAEIETTADLPETYGVELGVLYLCDAYQFDYIDFTGEGSFVDGNDNSPYGASGYMTTDGQFVPFETEGEDIVVCYDTASLYHTPRVLTWQERLEKWAIEQALAILNFIGTINNALIGVLQGLLKDIV